MQLDRRKDLAFHSTGERLKIIRNFLYIQNTERDFECFQHKEMTKAQGAADANYPNLIVPRYI
jgi:hypothetical protein